MFADRCEFHMGKTLDDARGIRDRNPKMRCHWSSRFQWKARNPKGERERERAVEGWEGTEPRKSDPRHRNPWLIQVPHAYS